MPVCKIKISRNNSSKLYYLIARTFFEVISRVLILVRFHQIYIHNTSICHLQEAGYYEAKERLSAEFHSFFRF